MATAVRQDRYRLFSRDTKTMNWEPSEIILTADEIEVAIDHLLKVAALAAFEFRGGPVFIQPLGDNDLMYVSFEEIK